ncbi:HD domain-containing phosphohydrolase [Lacrimispora amygdalina]|uniref:HD domain-containing phosphohydrolase n=1 Tax=Lacrimispora amygdalina TaxID=253257 RepID=UPI000BE39226|nr:HD domain-containing phosphohydrolase [Lacrimispora amygdalina]
MFSHIRIKMLLIVIPVLCVVIMLSYNASVRTAKRIVDRETSERISAEEEIQKNIIEKNMNAAAEISRVLAVFGGTGYKEHSPDYFIHILEPVVRDNRFILGAGIWYEPYLYNPSRKYMGPYVYKKEDRIIPTFDYSNSDYDYFSQDYYSLAKKNKKTVWTDMYYDQTSSLYMITCSQPVLDQSGNYIGCVTVDVGLSSMQKFVSDYIASYDGTTCIISKDGTYLAAENEDLVKEKVSVYDSSNSSFQEAVARIMSSEEGNTVYYRAKQRISLYYKTLNDLGWKIIFEIPESSIHMPLHELSDTFILIFGLSLLFMSLTIFFLTENIIDRPVKAILSELKQSSEKLEQSLKENVASQKQLIRQNKILTERETQMYHSLKYTSSLMEAIPDTVFVISKEGIFLDCIGDREHLFFSKEEFIGKYISDVIPTNIANKSREILNQVFLTGENQKIEYEWINGQTTEYHELRVVKWFDDKVIAIARNITETHNYIKEIEEISYYDQVTGLHNRRYFDKKEKELNQAGYYPMSVIFSDLNGLKLVNDSFGHEYGDSMLKRYAGILMNSGKDTDLISRVGGDEFAIILKKSDQEDTEQYIRELKEKCKGETINGIELSVSFGYCIIKDSSLSVQNAVKLAEDEMYQNKLYEAYSRRSKTLEIILNTLHEKNPREEQHSQRVAEICELMAKNLEMSDSDIKKIRAAGLLHDIGKIGIKEELLNKPGALTEDEFQEIRRHSEIGYRILNTAPNMSEIAEIVLCHHERWDGKGYPKGRSKTDIPLFARIITIADAYDAMTSDRSYRKALPSSYAREELIRGAGKQFDPQLVDFFVKQVMG